LICVANPGCIAYDTLETSLYTPTLPDQYCGREGDEYVDQCEAG